MSITKLKEIIDNSNNIIFFGGAGVSTESGIPDFRSANGLYSEKTNNYISPEDILSHSFFIEHTKDFYEFYKEKMIYKNAEPNYAHLLLADLEKAGKVKAVITQNIDGLHQKAGSRNVLELHGSIHRNYCTSCNKFFPLEYIINSINIPKCDVCGHTVKPDVVLYEESLDLEVLNKSIYFIENSEVLIVGGTSLTVYPSAGLIRYYKGDKLVLINKSVTQYDNRADLVIYDKIGETLKKIL